MGRGCARHDPRRQQVMDVREAIAVVTANVGNFEPVWPHCEQSVPYDFYRFDNSNFPHRKNSMMPRLQARIPKMFGWQMAPGYSAYLWIDSSMVMEHPDSVQWFLDHLKGADIAVFAHPHRKTIGEEAEYLKYRFSIDCPYITPRYEFELLDEQMAEINNPDLPLYATTAMIYRPTYDIKRMMKEWWYHTSRYHSIDQLSLAYAMSRHHIKPNVIRENYLKTPYITHVRKRQQKSLPAK